MNSSCHELHEVNNAALAAAVSNFLAEISHRPLHRVDGHTITNSKDAVDFADCTSVWLHRVIVNGVPDTYLRAADMRDRSWVIFDLRSLLPDFAQESRGARAIDVPGLIYWGARVKYHTASVFLRHVGRAARLVATPANNELNGGDE